MYRFFIRGVVQGVGFRPYIYNACVSQGLKGYVQNIGNGVVIVADDKAKVIQILDNVPKLARIDSYDISAVNEIYEDFTIKMSSGEGFAEIPADLFLCEDCYMEMQDASDRRHKYFFTTCTNCGPRFSMVKKSPYDRHTTTMDEFQMCDKCRKEYTDPTNRRYHAQTVACKECGPRLFLNGIPLSPVERAANLIKQGKIVAIKGVGGYHLACSLQDGQIKRLREITGREHKPYAVMCHDIKMAAGIAVFGDTEKQLLESVERPIVVLNAIKKTGATELDTIGVMLPYTALHYLLFDYLDEPIVMTSSNVADEPITIDKKEQIAEHVLYHTRRIENPVDDSVIKVIGNVPLFIRRSRGYVPRSIDLPGPNKQILALGAELSNTFCVYKNGKAIMSQYMGTTSNAETFGHFKRMVDKFLDFTSVRPDLILADKHPDYNTSRYAQELAFRFKAPLVRVQHHLAHAYSVAAENDLDDFTAIVCDGLGFGEDGKIWGGEVFVNKERIGHLEEHLQLGGDSAAKYPAKMLFSILRSMMHLDEIRRVLRNYYTDEQLNILDKQYQTKFNSVMTTSTGRVFDAASFLLGFCAERTYDGRPAMLLEANSSTPFKLKPVFDGNVLLTTPLFKFLLDNLDKDRKRLAATVQQYVAEGLYSIAKKQKKPVVFSGGCAYSRIMTGYMLKKGVLVNQKVPAGDGGVSFGQIACVIN